MPDNKFVYDARAMAYIRVDSVDYARLINEEQDGEGRVALFSRGTQIGTCRIEMWDAAMSASPIIPAQPGWFFSRCGIDEAGRPKELERWDVVAFRNSYGFMQVLTMDGWQGTFWPVESEYPTVSAAALGPYAEVIGSPEGTFYAEGMIVADSSEGLGRAWIEKCADIATWKAVWDQRKEKA